MMYIVSNHNLMLDKQHDHQLVGQSTNLLPTAKGHSQEL